MHIRDNPSHGIDWENQVLPPTHNKAEKCPKIEIREFMKQITSPYSENVTSILGCIIVGSIFAIFDFYWPMQQ